MFLNFQGVWSQLYYWVSPCHPWLKVYDELHKTTYKLIFKANIPQLLHYRWPQWKPKHFWWSRSLHSYQIFHLLKSQKIIKKATMYFIFVRSFFVKNALEPLKENLPFFNIFKPFKKAQRKQVYFNYLAKHPLQLGLMQVSKLTYAITSAISFTIFSYQTTISWIIIA